MTPSDFLVGAFPGEGEPGACLVVAREGEVIVRECRGLADLHSGRAIDFDTTFRLASITKQFTASLVLLLRASGRLKLDDAITKYLPEMAAAPVQRITLRHLLQHTSGLLDYEDHVPKDLQDPLSDEDVLRITAQHDKTYFPPGTQFRYSNTGYALLACIIERITGKALPLVLEETLFEPLGMTNAVARHTKMRPDVPNRAMGYRRMPDGTYMIADQNLTSAVLGDGGIYCSANDYLKWDRAYWGGKVLPPEVVREMTTPGLLLKKGTASDTDRIWFPLDMNERMIHMKPAQGSDAGEACYYAGGELAEGTCQIPYGMGWRLEMNEQGLAVAYHPGSSTGFMHCVRHVAEKDLTVLVLANRTVGPSKELARDVEAAMLRAG
jgi:CubicO group peptidase (beta-lactamase class C family)